MTAYPLRRTTTRLAAGQGICPIVGKQKTGGMKMKLINLTPHAVTIVNEDGAIIATYPSEGEARIAQTNAPSGVLDRVPICKVTYGEAKTGLLRWAANPPRKRQTVQRQ